MTDLPPAAGYPVRPADRAPIPVTMSTASAFPETIGTAFALAAGIGYDGLELMVMADQLSQQPDPLRQLMDRYELPILSVHSPCLLISSRVWSTDPLVKLARSIDLAEQVDASVVVVHPPFVWQRAAASDFVGAVAELQARTQVRIAVENMFPLTVGRGRFRVNAYRPHWNPVPLGHRYFTLDLSHTATAGVDALEMMDQMGQGLVHLHLTDGGGGPTDRPEKDEHLVPGRGGQPCAEVLEGLAANGFRGSVCVEISTRGISRQQREADLEQSLAFARLALHQS